MPAALLSGRARNHEGPLAREHGGSIPLTTSSLARNVPHRRDVGLARREGKPMAGESARRSARQMREKAERRASSATTKSAARRMAHCSAQPAISQGCFSLDPARLTQRCELLWPTGCRASGHTVVTRLGRRRPQIVPHKRAQLPGAAAVALPVDVVGGGRARSPRSSAPLSRSARLVCWSVTPSCSTDQHIPCLLHDQRPRFRSAVPRAAAGEEGQQPRKAAHEGTAERVIRARTFGLAAAERLVRACWPEVS